MVALSTALPHPDHCGGGGGVSEQGWERLSHRPGAWGPSDRTRGLLPVRDEGWGFPMALMRDLHGSTVTGQAGQVPCQESP